MGLDALDLALRLEERLGIKVERDEGAAVLFGTVGTIHRYLMSKLQGEYRQAPRIEPLYVEVRRAINRIRGRWRLSRSSDLNRLFPAATRTEQWQSLEQALGISLPTLEHPADGGFPSVPRQYSSMPSLVYWIAEHYPNRVEWVAVSCESTGKAATRQWKDDEVWEVLKESICDAMGVKPDKVTPDARMIEDLGMS